MYKETIVTKNYINNDKFEYERFVAESYNELFRLLKKNFRQYNNEINNFPSYTTDGIITLIIYVNKNEYIKIIDDTKKQIYHYMYDNNIIQIKKIIKFLNFKDMFNYIAIITQSEILSN